MRKGSHMSKRSCKLISLAITGKGNPMYGKKHSKKTKLLIRKKSLEQFKNGMPESTKRKMIKASKRRVFLSIGNTFITGGYVWEKIGKQKYVAQHRYIIEKYIGRKLKKNELVHHIDGNKSNNNLTNLYIFTNKVIHLSFEMLIKYNYLKRNYLKTNIKEFKKK